MVECHLAKVKVAGPNPVSRSTKSNGSRKAAVTFCGTDGIAHLCASAQRVRKFAPQGANLTS